MNPTETNSPHFVISIQPCNTNRYAIELKIKSTLKIDANKVDYIAAKPPDFRTSFSGSALPFYNEEQAYENTPTKGSVILNNNVGIIRFQKPNSYYVDLGNVFVKQHVQLHYTINNKKNVLNVKLSDGIPYRSLTYPSQRTSASFYDSLWGLPVRSQETIIRESAYPVDDDVHYMDFWGPRPPN